MVERVIVVERVAIVDPEFSEGRVDCLLDIGGSFSHLRTLNPSYPRFCASCSLIPAEIAQQNLWHFHFMGTV